MGTTSQKISMVISLISMVVAASRAFFILREERTADPEPSPHMLLRYFYQNNNYISTVSVFVRVVPGMAVVLIYNLATWTFMMGILKGWTLMVVLFVFITTYLANKVWS